MVDQGTSVNILYWKTFKQMDLSKDLIVSYNEKIIGFAGERVDARGYVDLRTSLGADRGAKEMRVKFLLVKANTSYNVLLRRPCLNAFRAIVSTPHLTLKYPTDRGAICYATGLKFEHLIRRCKVRRSKVAMEDLDPKTNTDDQIR